MGKYDSSRKGCLKKMLDKFLTVSSRKKKQIHNYTFDNYIVIHALSLIITLSLGEN